jgi:hypothetical protein
MVLTDLIKVLQHSGFLTAVLAGFAVTLFVGLLTAASERRVVVFAAGAALVAAAFLGVSTIAGFSGVAAGILDPASAAGPAHQSTAVGALNWMKYSFLLGMAAFVVSLGLCGWIRSTWFGIVSTMIAVATILSLVYFMIAVVRAF